MSTGNGRLPVRRRVPGRRTAHIGFRRAAASPSAESGKRRRWNETLSSASVILAGVLVVVGFAFIATKAMKGSGGEPLPDPAPPAALGGATLPSAGAGLIPLGSPSPSPSSASPTPSRTKPSTQAPDPGAISLATGGVPSLVDLSAEGTRDWVHWGEESTFSLERDKDGGFDILEGTPTAPRFRHALSPQRFAWTGGDPVDHSDGTPTGVRTCGQGQRVHALRAGRHRHPRAAALRGRGRRAGPARGEPHRRFGDALRDARGTGQRLSGTAVYTLTYRAPKTAKISLKLGHPGGVRRRLRRSRPGGGDAALS